MAAPATSNDSSTPFPMYEFAMPDCLVGLLKGTKGKTIKVLARMAGVAISFGRTANEDTFQICGNRDQVNRCVRLLRQRFTQERFPELSLAAILTMDHTHDTQPKWLSLPHAPTVAYVVHIQSAGHIFIHQPCHPSFPFLAGLDQSMCSIYSLAELIPGVPESCPIGLLCAAPVGQAWFRAVIEKHVTDTDEVIVRLVDVGGYWTTYKKTLRQISSYVIALPFQASECLIAHIRPIDGTSQWSPKAAVYLRDLVAHKQVEVAVIGYKHGSNVPIVELTVEYSGERCRVDRIMVNKGYAQSGDLYRVQPIPRLCADGVHVI